jgi:hypothetical protein
VTLQLDGGKEHIVTAHLGFVTTSTGLDAFYYQFSNSIEILLA